MSPVIDEALNDLEKKIENENEISHSLTEEERKILKSCDLLELFLWTEDQMAMGNFHVQGINENCLDIIFGNDDIHEKVKEFVEDYFWMRTDENLQ